MIPFFLIAKLAAQQIGVAPHVEALQHRLLDDVRTTSISLLGEGPAATLFGLGYVAYRREIPLRLSDGTTVSIAPMSVTVALHF